MPRPDGAGLPDRAGAGRTRAAVVRDRYASPAAPLFFAAGLMAAVVLALVAFRAAERAPRTAEV